MAESKYLTLDEELQIGSKAGSLYLEGHIEEARELGKQLAMSPLVAQAWVSLVGKEVLRNSGFNMYEVEQAYGKDWLTDQVTAVVADEKKIADQVLTLAKENIK